MTKKKMKTKKTFAAGLGEGRFPSVSPELSRYMRERRSQGFRFGG